MLGFYILLDLVVNLMEISKINFDKKGLNSVIGELEADIMGSLWQKKEKQTCREIYGKVEKKNEVAYTTISVTLDRMYSRGLVERDVEKGPGGLKYKYGAKVSKEELANNLSKSFVKFLKSTFGEPSIAYLKKNI